MAEILRVPFSVSDECAISAEHYAETIAAVLEGRRVVSFAAACVTDEHDVIVCIPEQADILRLLGALEMLRADLYARTQEH